MTSHLPQRILHVDDEMDIREVASLALEGVGGFSVESCASGEEALERAPVFRPDLILLDVMMPGMDGPTTFRALERIPEVTGTPVIFMTAKAQSHELAAYHDCGALGVITKPFDPMTLHQRIEEIWAIHIKVLEDRAFVRRLDELSARYREKLRDSVATLDRIAADLRGRDTIDAITGVTLKELKALAHRLVGSGASFGYARISEAALVLERAVDAVSEPSTGHSEDLQTAIADLRRQLAAIDAA